MKIAVTALGVVAPGGIGEAAYFASLAAQTSAISRDSDGNLGARVSDFGAAQHIAPGSLRRLPRLSQMTIVAAKQALATAQLPYDPTRIGVVLGTGLGTLEETIAFMRGYVDGGIEAASPLLFPSSVMNAAAGQLALECKLRGVNSTVNHRDASPLLALTMACDLLALGRADALLVGGVDELSAPLLQGLRALGGLSSTGLRPYSSDRDGFVPGEAAALVLLERLDDAQKRGATIRALVGGRGETGEDRPRVGWGHAGEWPAAARAVAAAANTRAGSSQGSADGPRGVDCVLGGGNGTALDERELAAISAGLGRLPPTASILPLVGESFASAMLRVLAAIFALEQQTMPGTLGLAQPPAPFAASLPSTNQPATIERVLVPSFAQGGANVAVVLERPF